MSLIFCKISWTLCRDGRFEPSRLLTYPRSEYDFRIAEICGFLVMGTRISLEPMAVKIEGMGARGRARGQVLNLTSIR